MLPKKFIFALLVLSSCNAYALRFKINPNSDIVGEVTTVTVKPGQTFFQIARDNDLGTLELIEANPDVNPDKLKVGQEILLPTAFILPEGPRQGIVLNLAELRLYFFHPDGRYVSTFPVGIGRLGWRTPVGSAKIVRKRENPTWTPPASIRRSAARNGRTLPAVMPAGPNNPLGDYAMNLSWPRYLIHGTNKPTSVGMRSSSGCIRLYPEDIETLYKLTPMSTPVYIIHQPFKIGQRYDELYMEAHQPLSEAYYELADDEEDIVEDSIHGFRDFSSNEINWRRTKSHLKATFGYPVLIGIDD